MSNLDIQFYNEKETLEILNNEKAKEESALYFQNYLCRKYNTNIGQAWQLYKKDNNLYDK